jgi:hypothetical protein
LGEIGISIKGTEQILTAGFGRIMLVSARMTRAGCQGTSGRDCAGQPESMGPKNAGSERTGGRDCAGHPEAMGPKNRPAGAGGCCANRPLDIASPINTT